MRSRGVPPSWPAWRAESWNSPPGRQAGFHVDRIVARARRTVELLNETSPNTAAANEQTGLVAIDVMAGMTSLGFGELWSERARGIMKSDVGKAGGTVLQLANELTPVLTQSPVDLPAARTKAAALLGAAEDLRARAYAFEDRRGMTAGGTNAQSGDSAKP